MLGHDYELDLLAGLLVMARSVDICGFWQSLIKYQCILPNIGIRLQSQNFRLFTPKHWYVQYRTGREVFEHNA